MQVFSRKPTSKDSRVAHNPARTRKQLNFLNFLNPRNEKALKTIFATQELKTAFTDVAASLVAQLSYREYLDHLSVLRDIFEFFESKIQSSGYKLIADTADLIPDAQDQRMEMMVAGSQTRVVSRARVDAAIEFIQALRPPKIRVVFSGANPAQGIGSAETMEGRAHIIDESAMMRSYFVSRLAEVRRLKGINIQHAEESSSKNTVQNIANYFTGLSLSPEARNHVVIVSSTFHLPRFITLTDSYLSKNLQPLDRITFVGSEDATRPNAAMNSQNYLKSAMFEFFTYLHDVDNVTELLGTNEIG